MQSVLGTRPRHSCYLCRDEIVHSPKRVLILTKQKERVRECGYMKKSAPHGSWLMESYINSPKEKKAQKHRAKEPKPFNRKKDKVSERLCSV